jgi:ribosomal protein L11 methyltransferase
MTRARESAIVNLSHNKLDRVKVHEEQIEALTASYDFVVANIIDGVLVRLREDLFRLTKPGGHLLVTGVLDERKSDFLMRFMLHLDLELLKEHQFNEWWGFLFRRKS